MDCGLAVLRHVTCYTITGRSARGSSVRIRGRELEATTVEGSVNVEGDPSASARCQADLSGRRRWPGGSATRWPRRWPRRRWPCGGPPGRPWRGASVTGGAGVLGLDAFLQHGQRLGAQLRHPGLGHAEEAGQLLRGAALEEVADDHQAVALGQQVARRHAGRRAARGSRAPRAARPRCGRTARRPGSGPRRSSSLTSCSRARTTERNRRSCRRASSSWVMPEGFGHLAR